MFDLHICVEAFDLDIMIYQRLPRYTDNPTLDFYWEMFQILGGYDLTLSRCAVIPTARLEGNFLVLGDYTAGIKEVDYSLTKAEKMLEFLRSCRRRKHSLRFPDSTQVRVYAGTVFNAVKRFRKFKVHPSGRKHIPRLSNIILNKIIEGKKFLGRRRRFIHPSCLKSIESYLFPGSMNHYPGDGKEYSKMSNMKGISTAFEQGSDCRSCRYRKVNSHS